MNLELQWRRLQSKLTGTWGRRIRSEIEFLRELPQPQVATSERDTLIREAVADLDRAAGSGVREQEVLAAEETLAPLAEAANGITLQFIAHAHIDMNWMWAFDETAVITVETIRTLLALLDQYPQLTFSQSQAAVYRLLERFAPELLGPIRDRIAEDRWELAATQWTECDMNLPSTESLLRHPRCAIEYLRELFDVDRDALRVAFMPDTFGLGIHTPELLAQAGVHFVYHCRGQVGPYAARWFSPSGRSVLAYQDPRWYNERPDQIPFAYVAKLVTTYGLRVVPAVYGVGDHGGGPTRRDIEAILEMQQWPLAPRVTFGTYHEFFARLQESPNLPQSQGERNPVFTGCYSSQQRIKEANRRCERSLYLAELLDATAGRNSTPRPDFTEAWRAVLFNHFHDILPGSGVAATRAHALGNAQEALAITTTSAARSARRLMRELDTAVEAERRALAESLALPIDGATVGAAGVGYGQGGLPGIVAGSLGAASNRDGLVRPYLVVNPLPVRRADSVEVVVWDWPAEAPPPRIVDSDGTTLTSSRKEREREEYWGHYQTTLSVIVPLEPFGYRVLYAVPELELPGSFFNPYGVEDWLVARRPDYTLANEHLSATIDSSTFAVSSLVERQGGRHLLGSGGARLVLDAEEGGHMSAWIERPAHRPQAVGPHGRLIGRSRDGDRFQWLSWKSTIGATTIHVSYELAPGSRELQIRADVSFREIGTGDVIRLRLAAETPGTISSLLSDVPGGTIRRDPQPLSVAVSRFAAAAYKQEHSGSCGRLVVYTPNSQAVLATGSELSVVLLRATSDPDPAPEVGEHQFLLALSGDHEARPAQLQQRAACYAQPPVVVAFDGVAVPSNARKDAATRGVLMEATLENAELLSVVRARSDGAILLRLAAGEGGGGGSFDVGLGAVMATEVDALEEPVDTGVDLQVRGSLLTATIPANRVCSILVARAD